MTRLPALFVSHGAPTLAIDPVPTRDFLSGLGGAIERPRAILAVSAHWETDEPAVSAAAAPETIYDFRGFPDALYRLRYPAPGEPALAARAAGLLGAAGIEAAIDPGRGLDHGAWVPLILMYPAADVPVLQLSVQPRLGPEHHLRLGEALRPLRDDGVLVLGTGSITHNLREIRRGSGADTPAWVSEFSEWTAQALAAQRTADLIEYRERAPHAARNHPTEEHFLPLFVALGAGTPGVPPQRLHQGFTFGVIGMDAYRFD